MDMKFYKSYAAVGLSIMYQRKRQGLTQEALSEKIGISRQQLQRIETANSAPSLDTLFRLAQVLEVPVATFFQNIEQ